MTASFPAGTFADLQGITHGNEDRTDLVRLAVRLLIKLRSSPAYVRSGELLRAGETEEDMAVKGFAQISALRREALETENRPILEANAAQERQAADPKKKA